MEAVAIVSLEIKTQMSLLGRWRECGSILIRESIKKGWVVIMVASIAVVILSGTVVATVHQLGVAATKEVHVVRIANDLQRVAEMPSDAEALVTFLVRCDRGIPIMTGSMG